MFSYILYLFLLIKASKATGEVEESISAEDISRVEMKLWDEKFSQSVAKDSSEATRDDDS